MISLLFYVSGTAQTLKSRMVNFTLCEYEIVDSTFKKEITNTINLFFEQNNPRQYEGKEFVYDHINLYLGKEGNEYVLYLHLLDLWDGSEKMSGYMMIDDKLVIFGVLCPDPHWFKRTGRTRAFSYKYLYYVFSNNPNDICELGAIDDNASSVREKFIYDGTQIKHLDTYGYSDGYSVLWRKGNKYLKQNLR